MDGCGNGDSAEWHAWEAVRRRQDDGWEMVPVFPAEAPVFPKRRLWEAELGKTVADAKGFSAPFPAFAGLCAVHPAAF